MAQQTITITSSGPWTPPSDWPGYADTAFVLGSGGGSAGTASSGKCGSSSGGAGLGGENHWIVPAGTVCTVTIGAPGTAGTTTANGGDGADTTVTGSGVVTLTGHGGKGGAITGGTAGAGGLTSSNSITHSGGAGQIGQASGSFKAPGGGSSAGTVANGNAGQQATSTAGGAGGLAVTDGGPGGTGATTGAGSSPASGYGGGAGAGYRSSNGAAGSQGVFVVRYTPVPPKIWPGLSSTLLQPGNASNLSWTQARMNTELYGSETGMWQAGMKTVIMQWCADPYQNTAYYPSPTIPNNAGQLVPQLFTAAGQTSPSMGVWLGLSQYDGTNGNDYYNFYYNCVNPGTGWVMGTLLAFQKKVAQELYALYGSAIKGWYIPQETDGNYAAGSTQAATAATYYQALISWLHTTFPGMPVMVSPFYADLHLTASQFASTITQLFIAGGGNTMPDVIALQSGAGDASIGDSSMTPAQITSYFGAVWTAIAETGVVLWENCDMYSGSGGPLATFDLAASMAAAAPYVSDWTGFSFTSQMSPQGLGSTTVYDAYVAALTPPSAQGLLMASPC